MQSRYRTRQTKIYLFAMGKSGGTCRPMMQGISLCDHVTNATNQDFICLLWGEAEVRVASNFPLWVPKSKPRLRLFAFGRAET